MPRSTLRASPAPLAISFSALLLVAGCTIPAPRDPNRLMAHSASIRAECASQSTHLAREQCANPRLLALYRADGADPVDVAAAYFARREAIAEKMDKREISETEGAAEMAEARVAANAAVQQRQRPSLVCTTSAGVTVCQ